jgi:hypothetical protein
MVVCVRKRGKEREAVRKGKGGGESECMSSCEGSDV